MLFVQATALITTLARAHAEGRRRIDCLDQHTVDGVLAGRAPVEQLSTTASRSPRTAQQTQPDCRSTMVSIVAATILRDGASPKERRSYTITRDMTDIALPIAIRPAIIHSAPASPAQTFPEPSSPVEHRPARGEILSGSSASCELMSYHHNFIGETEGIRPMAPVRWQCVDGLMVAFWEARGEAAGRGYYLSTNPRISVFFADVSSIRVSHSEGRDARADRPLARAFYVPAGVPMWTSFTKPFAFSHLDIHLDRESAVRFLAPAVDCSAALERMRYPAERAEAVELEGLARALAAEITRPRARARVESLAAALFAGLLAPEAAGAGEGRLTCVQMRRITERFDAGRGRRLSVAEMSETVNLSESWFSNVFKNTTGLTPSQWQLGRRVDLARCLLADGGASLAEIAHDLGFTDQAHFTRVFRRHSGETPAAWRRGRGRG